MKTLLTIASVVLVWQLYSSISAFAFPENVRHGYTHCASCHVNPNGGGLLNEYGRQLSKAVQSNGRFFFEPAPKAEAASSEVGDDRDRETEFLYGVLPKPDWLNLGGDIRLIQVFGWTPRVDYARFIDMQADLEAAATYGMFTLDATIGEVDPGLYGNKNPDVIDYVLSRRHYLLFQMPVDNSPWGSGEFFAMAGKFWKPFGTMDPNHKAVVKESLGWTPGTESYNLEVGYSGNLVSALVFGDLGRPDNTALGIEQGGGATVSLGFASTYSAGASYFYGTNDFFKRHVFGPWGLLGFTEHFYLRTETDFESKTPKPSGTSTFGVATYNRLGYEVVQGFHVYVEQNFAQLDLTSAGESRRRQDYGIGIAYYPRPHFELMVDYLRRKDGVALGFGDYLYFQVHYYL